MQQLTVDPHHFTDTSTAQITHSHPHFLWAACVGVVLLAILAKKRTSTFLCNQSTHNVPMQPEHSLTGALQVLLQRFIHCKADS